MRRIVWLLAALLALPSLGSDSPKEYDDKTEKSDIEGTWQFVALSDQGTEIKPDQPWIVTFWGGKWSSSMGGYHLTEGTYTTDRSHFPAFYDLINKKGRGIKCIYSIEGNTLRIANPVGGRGERPTSFNEQGLCIETWKRVPK